MKSLVLVLGAYAAIACASFSPKPGNFPPNGNDTVAGGIFSISLTNLFFTLRSMPNGGMGTGAETPKNVFESTAPDGINLGGSGQYGAIMTTDPQLPDHTIYAPKQAPPGVEFPFIAWGNGACMTDGAAYKEFLLEIASHGYVIAADGAPIVQSGFMSQVGSLLGSGFGLGNFSPRQSTFDHMADSIDWAMKGGSNQKYGKIDTNKIAAAGHSCGGLESYSQSYKNPKVKLTMLFNIAIFQDDRRYLLQELKAPVAYFIGGPSDMGFDNAEKDYILLPKGLPAYKINLDTGHMGTYKAKNGGKFGEAAVKFLDWQFKDDAAARQACLEPNSPNSLASKNWQVAYKNWPGTLPVSRVRRNTLPQ